MEGIERIRTPDRGVAKTLSRGRNDQTNQNARRGGTQTPSRGRCDELNQERQMGGYRSSAALALQLSSPSKTPDGGRHRSAPRGRYGREATQNRQTGRGDATTLPGGRYSHQPNQNRETGGDPGALPVGDTIIKSIDHQTGGELPKRFPVDEGKEDAERKDESEQT